MAIPSAPDLAAALRTHAPAGMTPAQIDELSGFLLTAMDEVRLHRPFSVRAVQAPWGGAALAFEASWPDTHTFIVAVRLPPEHGSPAQLTLRRAGQLVYAVSSTLEHLPTAVALCLGRHIKRASATDHLNSAEPPQLSSSL